jgi:glycine hydroxymethyltransferase
MESLMEIIRKHEEWRGSQTLNLIASENVASPQVSRLMGTDLLNRYTAPDKFYMGTKFVDETYEFACKIAREVFGAQYADPRPLSGHIADWILLSCFTKAGDSLLSVSPENGGYPGISHEGVTQFMSRKNLYFPFDDHRMNIKVDESAALIEREKPSLVVFGASFILFPPPVKELSSVAKNVGAKVAYDGAHVLGLIGGGKFQDPLHEGANILIGSTHKSLFGPQGGIILADSQFGKIVKDSIFPSFVDNAHYNRIAALAMALLELKSFGKAYSDQVIKNAKAIGKALDEQGVPVKCREQGYTESHQVHLDNSRIDSKFDHTRKLEEANIIVDKGTRIGTSEITRRGMKEGDMERIAELVGRIVAKKEQPERVKKDVIKLRQEFRGLEYYFKESVPSAH